MKLEISGVNVPDYLTSDYLENALKIGLKSDDIKLKSIKLSAGSSGGDNYCSQIIRAIVEYIKDDQENELALIIKSMPINKASDHLQTMEAFSKEVTMYMKFFPAIEKIVGEKLSPKCYYTSKEPIDTFIFEDMVAKNYHLGDRIIGLDYQHANLVMEQLGKVHAASMIWAKEDIDRVNDFNHGIFKKTSFRRDEDIVFGPGIGKTIDFIKSEPFFDSIVTKLQAIKANYFELLFETLDAKDDKIKVMNMGDLWVNNIMFKYENDKTVPLDVSFIDFQFSFFASPGIDLNYFLYTSVQLDVIQKHYYDLIRAYYKTFRSTLEQSNYSDLPTLDDIKNEIKAKQFYGLISLAVLLPLMSMDRNASKDNNIEQFRDETVMKKKQTIMYSSDRFCDMAKFCLERFDELGVLQIKNSK